MFISKSSSFTLSSPFSLHLFTFSSKALAAVYDDVKMGKCRKERKVYFDPALTSETISKLSATVTFHGGEVVDSLDTCTHHVIADETSSEEDDEYCRTIEITGEGLSLVHWWYYPDSYDVWINSAEIEGINKDLFLYLNLILFFRCLFNRFGILCNRRSRARCGP